MSQEALLWKHSLQLTKYVEIYPGITSLYEHNDSKRWLFAVCYDSVWYFVLNNELCKQ